MKKTNKEILLAFCNTLSEANSIKAYKLLTEEFEIRRPVVLKFNRDGVEDKKEGKVRLRRQDVGKITELLGEKYLLLAIQIMYDYISYLEQQAPYDATKRRKLRDLKTRNHYIDLTRGWVAEKIEKNYPAINRSLDIETLSLEDVKTLEQARTFVKQLPSYLRINNPEVDLLVMKYPELLEEI
jgi:hypothetical protein